MTASALRTLRAKVQEFDKNLAPSVWIDLPDRLERWLLRILQSALSAKVALAVSFKKSAFKSPENFSVNLGITASELGLKGFSQFLPAAKQTVDLVVKDWIKAQSLTLSRLHRDRNRLSPILPRGSMKRLKHITPGLSDPHDHGQTVTMLEFSSGQRIVYKPRGCEGERIWFSALRWLNKKGFTLAFYIPNLTSHCGYSWMSCVEHRSCKSIDAVRRFYFRWGAQTAVAQLLGCVDLHHQNWVASGEHPVLVDCEMLGHAFSNLGVEYSFNEHLHPLLKTGLLHLSCEDKAGYYRHIAPFDSDSIDSEQRGCWPVYAGKLHRPEKYRDKILEGFTAAWSFLCTPPRQKYLKNFVVCASHRKHLRVLKRATANYSRILQDSLQPEHLREPGRRLQYLLERCGRDETGTIEANSLLRCCIPRFTKNVSAQRGQKNLVISRRQMLNSAKILAARLARN
jgi:lantibiotic modifying enzyme